MAHVWYHCGTVGELQGEIPIVIKDGATLNFAAALKRRDETDAEWERKGKKLKKMVDKFYAEFAHPGDPVAYHPPSYVHPEP